MNNGQLVLITVTILVVAIGVWHLWFATGSTRAKKPTVVVVNREPSYKIVEKFGRFATLVTDREVQWSGPCIYYQVLLSWFDSDGDRQWSKVTDQLTLAAAEKKVFELVQHNAEKDKVRPSWSYRKDGSPYLEDVL